MNSVRQPALRATLLLSIGIALGRWAGDGARSLPWEWVAPSAPGDPGFDLLIGPALLASLTAAILILLLAASWRRGDETPMEAGAWAALHMASIVLTGWSLSCLVLADRAYRDDAFEWSRRVFGEEMALTGRLEEIRPSRSGWTMRVDVEGWGPSGLGTVWDLATHGRFQLQEDRAPGMEAMADPPARPGDRLHLTVRLQPAEPNRNPGGFDYAGWLAGEGIMLTGVVVGWRTEAREPGAIQRLRNMLMDRIRSQYSPSTAPFVMAFVLGYRSELHQDVKEAFSRAGLSHIMAVSGLHVGFVIAPLWFVIPWLGGGRAGRLLGFFLLLGVLALYSALTGFSVSVNRASIMAGLVGARRVFHLPGDSINTLSTAAFLLLLIRPTELQAPGFQLSFGAVALLMVWLPPIQQQILDRVRWPPAAGLLSMLAVTAGIQTGLAPLLGWWFGEVSWIAPASNLLVVPMLSALMPLTLLSLLIGDGPASILGVTHLTEIAFRWILTVSEWTGSTDAHVVKTGEITAWIAAGWIGFLLMVRPGMESGSRWRMLRVNLALLALAGIWTAAERIQAPPLEIMVLDVGQGDAIVIHAPDGSTHLIDAGWKEGERDSGARTILPYLASRGITRIDGLYLTHPHADHIGGAAALMEGVTIARVGLPPSSHRSGLTAALDSVMASRRIPVDTLLRGAILDLGAGVWACVLHPGSEPSSSEVNDGSLTLQIRYGRTRFLFTGDAQRRSEEEMMSWFGEELRSDVLKAGHHGSRTSSTHAFLDAVDPDMAVVSVALRNRYRLPNRDAVLRIRSHASDVAFTSLDGPIRLFSDSEKIRMIKAH